MNASRVLIEAAQAVSDRRDVAGVGSVRNGHRSRIRTVAWTHFASPPRGQGTQGCLHGAHGTRRNRQMSRAPHPSRQSFGTARRIRGFRKPLGLNP
jgi:hypothetical protein